MESLPVEDPEIVYEAYSIDYESIFRSIYENVIGGDWVVFLAKLSKLWDVYSVIAIVLSLIFFIGFIYAKIRLEHLEEIEEEDITHAEAEWARQQGGGVKSSRWEEVQAHVGSNNPNDWRLAIIEADIMLEETLTNAGYVGSTIGEKLKGANRASFRTVQYAWEAHKVRNEIAHTGSDFVLTKKRAQETIVQFERVFKEFGVI